MLVLGFSLAVLVASWPFSSASANPTLQRPLQQPGVIQNSHHDDLIGLHKSLVETPSISGSEANVTTFLIKSLESRGFTVQPQDLGAGRQNIHAYVGDSQKTRVLVTSHIDTVPPYWPYERRGDEIWGRGTVDAKGSVAAQIIAVESLVKENRVSEGDVALLFVVGEEVGGPGMREVNDLGLSWEAVIFGEPTELKLGRGHKGAMGFNVTAKGKAGHSGYPELGKNAISVLVRALYALDELELPSSDRFGNSTLNIGEIQGGVAGNVIAEDAFAVVMVRVAAGTPQSILELIEKAVRAASPDAKVVFGGGIGPVALDYDIEGFETTVLNYGTDVPNLKGDHKRYLYGPGTILVAHSDHEHLKISELEAAVEGYKRLILESLKR
ncbi:hypothetical protein B0H63DRAFT_556482 [Podospora didyma]|uniref:Peptidase M20 dimerisation domain-containing protein n=1 Tax=Podospora didyma TaxID=330526 RepID=A0AAE0U363_9PEZI|nr:hypothetical protein B0H63DRAFT_556482 [Podospora didyma]